MHRPASGSVRGRTTPDKTKRWLRTRAARTRGIRQATAREQSYDRAFQEGRCGANESASGSTHRRVARRNESRRPRAGGEFQGGRACGCKRRQQGQRFCGRREALALRGRRCDARFDVSPRTGRHRRQFVSVACLEEYALSGSHGQRASDGEELESRESGYGRKPAARKGIRAGAKRNVHFYQQDAQKEVSAVRLVEFKEGREIMPVVDVVNLSGKKVGEVELADAIFGAKVNPHLLHEATRWYQREIRSGTHKTKDKSEVSGAGRKLWRQKGTGRARVGSIRSPLWRHGGTVHGPKPRDYSYALPKKMLLGALRSALSSKVADAKLAVVDAWSMDTHKSKNLRVALGNLNGHKSALLVAHGENRNLELASRNLEGVKVSEPHVLQPYDVLKHDLVLLSKDAVLRLSHTLDPEKRPVVVPDVTAIAAAPKPEKKEAAPKAKAAAKKAKPAAKKAAKPAKKKGKE